MGLLDLFSNKKPSQQPPLNELPRAPRVTLVPLHNISFDLHDPIFCSGIKLANISASGIGFFKDKLKDWPASGSKLQGKLLLRDKSHEVSMIIVHSRSNIVGCHFHEPSGRLSVLIDQYFQVELSAMKLGKVDQQYVKKISGGSANWFRGSDNCELYAVTSGEEVISFNLSFFGNYIEYDQETNLKFGKIDDEDEETLQYKGTELVNQKVTIPTEIAESSIKFINNITDLPATQRNFICSIIDQDIDGPADSNSAKDKESTKVIKD